MQWHQQTKKSDQSLLSVLPNSIFVVLQSHAEHQDEKLFLESATVSLKRKELRLDNAFYYNKEEKRTQNEVTQLNVTHNNLFFEATNHRLRTIFRLVIWVIWDPWIISFRCWGGDFCFFLTLLERFRSVGKLKSALKDIWVGFIKDLKIEDHFFGVD